MEKDFLNNKFELINSNEKINLWRYKYEDLIQLWEYSLEDLGVEVEKFKRKLLDLEPCHKELLVLKLKEKGYKGDTMEEILQNSVLCYLKDEDQNKKLVYEYSDQKDPDVNSVKNLSFIPEIKKLLEEGDIKEIHKYRQTIIMLFKNNDTEKKYRENRLYFFAMSWFDIKYYKELDKVFSPLDWTAKLNKLTFQCLSLRDKIIFPLRIINIEYMEYPLTYEFDTNKQKFIGYFYTRFIDNYNGNNNFNMECRDKFYFIYHYIDHNKNFTGKDYRLYYYTGNPIWLELSILPYYKIILCEINWIYYTFILKYETIPHFYKYENQYKEIEIVISRFSLDEIYCKYEENGYDISELVVLKEVFYNHNWYKRNDITDKIFVEIPILKTDEEIDKFINFVLSKNKKL
jgi:hypothetical protein